MTAGREHTTDNKHWFKFKCKASCCLTCSFCTRAFPKERIKSQVSRLSLQKLRIKVCEKCFLCHSIVLCSTCNKCQKCCTKSACRGKTSELLANLAGSGSRSKSSSDPKRGLHPSLPDPAKAHKVTQGYQLLCQSPQEQLPVEGITSAHSRECCRTSKNPNFSGVFQQTISSPKIQQQVATYPGSEQTEPFPQGREIQDGNTGNHQDVPPTRGVGHLDRFQGRLLPYTNTGTIQEISEISCPGADLSVQGPALWSVHSTLGVYCDSKGSETNGQSQGYKDPPVPRRLVGESHIPPGLSSTYSESGENMSKIGLAGEFGKIRTGSKAGLRFCRLPVRPQGKIGQNSRNNVTATLSSSTIHVPDRVANSHRKTSSPRLATYDAHTVAPQAALENTRVTRKSDSNSQILVPSFAMVATGRQCSHRSTITPNKACSANLYRRIKRRVGRSLKRMHCQRDLVTARKQVAYKLFGTQGSVSGLERVSKPLCKQDSTCGNRQHHSNVIYKQGRRHEVGHTLCPTMENLDLVYQTSSNSKSPTYPRAAECGSRQAIQTGPDHSNSMVPPSRGFPSYMQQVAPTSDRSVCHKVQQQVTSVCVTSAGLLGSSSGCTQSAMGESGRIRLPTSGHLGQSGGEVAGLPLQENHSDCSGVAQHALVLGSVVHVQSDPTEPAQPVDTAFQSDPSQKSDKPKSPCMAPRATAIKEQGFFETVATRIEAPQRGSTRSVYEAKWAIFTKWCITNQVDFRAPPVKSVADFLMYLFEDRKFQPSTIDGYRSAIADKLGNLTLNISKDENLTRLLDNFP